MYCTAYDSPFTHGNPDDVLLNDRTKFLCAIVNMFFGRGGNRVTHITEVWSRWHVWNMITITWSCTWVVSYPTHCLYIVEWVQHSYLVRTTATRETSVIRVSGQAIQPLKEPQRIYPRGIQRIYPPVPLVNLVARPETRNRPLASGCCKFQETTLQISIADKHRGASSASSHAHWHLGLIGASPNSDDTSRSLGHPLLFLFWSSLNTMEMHLHYGLHVFDLQRSSTLKRPGSTSW